MHTSPNSRRWNAAGVFRDVDQLFGMIDAHVRGGFPVNVRDTGVAYEFVAQAPGFKREEISVTIEDRHLIIGVKENTPEAPEEGWLAREFHRRTGTRSAVLPEDADVSAVKASMEDGLLKIVVAKLQAKAAQTVNID